MRISRIAATVTAVAALALTVSACTTDSGGGATSVDTASLSSDAQAALDAAYTGIGSDLSDLQPAKPPAGVNFYVMSCGESNATCAAPAAAMVEAAKAAGWTGTIVDGKLNPDGFATAIRQATAAGANVIVPVGISCSAAAAAFTEAKAAGVTIVGGGGLDDCDPKQWASERLWLKDAPVPSIFAAIGTLQADYTFGRNNGDPKTIVINLTSNPWGSLVTQAYSDELTKLGGGQVLATVDVSDPESADNSYLQKVTSALLANPSVNSLVVPTDGYLVNGLAAAINQAGFGNITVVGGFGSAAALDLIRSGTPGITATVGDAQDWEAWGSVDTAIRVLDGLEPAYIGQSFQVVDADHNMPASGAYNGSIDWQSKFLTAWGK